MSGRRTFIPQTRLIIPFGIFAFCDILDVSSKKGVKQLSKHTESKRTEVERMKELMGDMTQKQFEEMTGVPQSTISKIFNNQRTLTADNILLIADAFDVSTDWLLGRTEQRKPQNPEPVANTMSYGDIFRVCTYLLKENAMTACPESFVDVDGREHILNRIQSLMINDEIIKSMLFEWYQTRSVSDDIYSDWITKRTDSYTRIPYLSWDAAIRSAFNHFFDYSDVSPETLEVFQKNLFDIFKEIQAERKED